MASDISRQSAAYKRFWLPFWRAVLAPLMWLLGPLEVKGAYRVPRQGGLLILPNHISDCDPPITQLACPRPVHFMAKEELFEVPILSWVIRRCGAFPVRRGSADLRALRHAVNLLKAGEAVVLYPEGQVSETGELQPLKEGFGWIAKTAGVPIICCGLTNTNRIIPYGKFLPRPALRRVTATWGEPRRFPPETPPEEIASWVEGQLRELTGA